MKPSIAIAGCGKVGATLGFYLTEKGYAVTGISCRTQESAQAAARILKTDHYGIHPWDITAEADVIFIGTPDARIEETCDAIAQNGGFKRGAVVFHLSGSLPSTILLAAKKCGVETGSLHPLQSFAAIDLVGKPFKGIIMAAEGSPKALRTAREVAQDLESTFIEIKTEAKTLYHAAAVVASNYLVALLGFAFDLLNEAGIPEPEAMMVLKPLINGTLANIEKKGVVKALTGPIVRGDLITVRSHLAQIKERVPELSDLYKILGRYAVGLTQKRGELDASKISGLRELLVDSPNR